jgi:hypothetical protein
MRDPGWRGQKSGRRTGQRPEETGFMMHLYADDSTKREWVAGKANELRQMRDPG